MMSTVGVRVAMGARYHSGACLGSLLGRQAPLAYLEGSQAGTFAAAQESGSGTVRQFAALQRRVRSWGQTSRHRRDSVTGEDDPLQKSRWLWRHLAWPPGNSTEGDHALARLRSVMRR